MRIIQVDAFTNRAFGGNPAAVCVSKGAIDESLMQHIALEMNLSETAFTHPEGDSYRLRWFTPRCEIDLCGHATLATAHVLWEEGHLRSDQSARFTTKSGALTCRLHDGWIEMDFPAEPVAAVDAPPDLAAVLGGAAARFVGKNRMDLLVELENETAVRMLRPDFGRMAEIPVRGVIATAKGDAASPFDFVSRFFAPRLGINEDPVCGSAHCALTPFWARRLGKTALRAYQASPRGGDLGLRLEGDRVILAGQAVTTLRGDLVF